MANAITDVGTLADEVALILKHDNIDSRILSWITSTYNDVISRAPLELFHRYITLTLTANSETVDITTLNDIGNPIALIYKDSTNNIYMPVYRTMVDYARVAHSMGGSTLTSSTVPLVWSLGPVPTDPQGKAHLHVYPTNPSNASITLFYTANRETAPLASSAYLDLPYHFEHVIVWGAVAKGYKALRPALYQLAKAEYEQALGDLYMVMGYRPDETPVLQSINGPYAGTARMNTPGRYPDARAWTLNQSTGTWS